MVRLGWPIGATMALEMGVFALAAYFMGWIGAPAVAAHAVALQLAALTFMVPLGLGQAATVRVGLALGRGDERRNHPRRLDGLGHRRRLHGRDGARHVAVPRPLVTLFLDDVPGQRGRRSRSRSASFEVAAAFQLVDGAQVIGAGMLRGLHDTRWPLIFALVGYWVRRARHRRLARVRRRLEGRRHLGRPCQRPGRGRGADARALGAARRSADSALTRPHTPEKIRSDPLTDERRTTICAASLALSYARVPTAYVQP